jgi:hypothetical protein
MHQERGASAPRGSRNRTGKGVRHLRCTNACAPGAGGVSPPWLAEPHRQGSATFAMHERTCIRSGGRQPPVVHGNAPARECDFCHGRTRVHQERGASAPRGSRQRTFKGFAPMSVRLPTVHQRTPTQSRCYILDNIHGGLTRAALALGESLPACAWRFPLHARSPNHGGLTPAALVSECERLPAKLRLLRCTNACAPGAGGVSPPWLAEPHRQGSATFAMHERTCSRSGGRQPPVARGTAPARECDFCDGRTHMHQERGASAPRGSRNALARASRQCRCDCRPCISGRFAILPAQSVDSGGATSSTTFTAG